MKYDNRFSVRETIIICSAIIIIKLVSLLSGYLIDIYWLNQHFVINWQLEAEQLFVIFSFAAIVLISLARCKYRILGDVLYVQEKLLWYVYIDTAIPLSTIDEIKLTRSFNRPRKHIQLRTGDAVYDLSCTTYRDELYSEIVNRIGRKQVSLKEKVEFYKQQNHG